MSFSITVKNELARVFPGNKGEQLAELSALLRTTGAIRIVGLSKLAFSVSTENPAVARKIFLLIKKCFDINVEIQVNEGSGKKKNKTYELNVLNEQGANKILEEIGIIKMAKDGLHFLENVPQKLISEQDFKKAYIRGAFLGCGSMNNPQKLYHMEFTTTDMDFCKRLSKIIASYNIRAKILTRKNMHVIYIKDSEQISDILVLMGAHEAMLYMQNIKVQKEVINHVNRKVNCDTANIERTVKTAQRQIECIQYIKEQKGLSYLPKNLQEIAKLRLKYYDMSLIELGKKMKKPLGKSGVNHRLKKIEEIAAELKEKLEFKKSKEE